MPDMSSQATPPVRQVGTRTVYASPWIRLTEDALQRADGTATTYAVLHARDFAVVIPFDGQRYLLVEQYRYPIGQRSWEFPQGTVAGDEPIAPQQVAETELAEETGLRAATFTHLGFLHESSGRSPNGFHAYLATGLTLGEPAPEPEEADLRTAWFTREEIWSMVDTGSITDASTVAALALLDRSDFRSVD